MPLQRVEQRPFEGEVHVLSLDGGGSHCGLLAVALGRLYGDDVNGREILRRFDVVAANSGGSIVLAALAAGYTPHEIAGFYADAAVVRRMFSPRWTEVFKPILPLRALLPPYSSRGKFKALAGLLDARRKPGEPAPSSVRLADWPALIGADVRLVVTAYDYDLDRAAYFTSSRKGVAASQGQRIPVRTTLMEAVHASTQGPVLWYGEPAEVGGRRYWDGGIAGCNNPVLVATAEALAHAPGAALRVASVGTGRVLQAEAGDGAPPPLGRPPAGRGLVTALRKLLGATMAEPPDAALGHGFALLGASADRHLLVRFCPQVQPLWDERSCQWSLPQGLSAKEFQRLVRMSGDTTNKADLALISKVGALWLAGLVPNQPIRTGSRLQCDIGDATFEEAAARWAAAAPAGSSRQAR
jgi:hypothetical protein